MVGGEPEEQSGRGQRGPPGIRRYLEVHRGYHERAGKRGVSERLAVPRHPGNPTHDQKNEGQRDTDGDPTAIHPELDPLVVWIDARFGHL